MSPEQAKGKPADKRSDIWAFGCVLYEMLTGKRAFDGEDLTDVVAAVVRGEPDWAALPADVPGARSHAAERLSRKGSQSASRRHRRRAIFCSTRDRRCRPGACNRAALARSAASRARACAMTALAALRSGCCALAHVAAVGAAARFPCARAPDRRHRCGRVACRLSARPSILSPDGTVHGVCRPAERREISPRSTCAGSISSRRRCLRGTEGALSPFFSPDGTWIGFFASGKLKKVAVSGGSPSHCAMRRTVAAASWGDDGWIVFTPAYAPARFSSACHPKAARLKSWVDWSKARRAQRWPQVLPAAKARHVHQCAGHRHLRNCEHRRAAAAGRSEKGACTRRGYYARYSERSSRVFPRPHAVCRSIRSRASRGDRPCGAGP